MTQNSLLSIAFDDNGAVSSILNADSDVRRVVDRAVGEYNDREPHGSATTAGRVDHQAVAEAVARAAALAPKARVSVDIVTGLKPTSSSSTRPTRTLLSTSAIYERRAVARGQLAAPRTFVGTDGNLDSAAIYGHRAAQIAAQRGRLDVAAFGDALEVYRAEFDGLDRRKQLDAASIYAARANSAALR